jgi:hypothetical protein
MKRPLKSAICHLLAVLCLATAGCATPRPNGGWQGPLFDPDGQPIAPPTYEVAP